MKRVLVALVAGLVALVTAVSLFFYVSSADRRAAAKQDPVRVLVVSKLMPQGTKASDAASYVTEKVLPKAAVNRGAVTKLSDLGDKEAKTDLYPGDQVTTDKFGETSEGKVVVPEGFHEITFALMPDRAHGAVLKRGDYIGVIYTVAKQNDKPSESKMILEKVLVVTVAGEVQPTDASAPQPSPSPTPTKAASSGSSQKAVPAGKVYVTVAVSAEDATRIAYAENNGDVWLTLMKADQQTEDVPVITESNIKK